MLELKEAYGRVRMNSNVPTVRAKESLSYFHSVGWHKCNSLYHQRYYDGIKGSLVIITVGGRGVLKLTERSFGLSAGGVAVIAPETPMEYYTQDKSEWEFFWINIYGNGTDRLVRMITAGKEGAVFNERIVGAERIIGELICLDNTDKAVFEIEASAKIQELLHLIARKISCHREEGKKHTVATEIISYIEKSYAEELTLDMLSDKFFVSQNQLIRRVKRETGFTPYEYLKRYRLMKSCELLRLSDIPVEEAGRAAGFSNVSNYIYQFRELYGITPLKYRKSFSPLKITADLVK